MILTRMTVPKTDESVIDIAGRNIQVGIPEQMRCAKATIVPLGRPGTPQEAAGAIAFLCSPWSDYVSGQVLNVGGGVPLGMSS